MLRSVFVFVWFWVCLGIILAGLYPFQFKPFRLDTGRMFCVKDYYSGGENSSSDSLQLSSKLSPGAGWATSFCSSHPDIGCTGVKVLSSCNAITPCALHPPAQAKPDLLPVEVAVPLGGAALLAGSIAWWAYSRRRRALASQEAKGGARDWTAYGQEGEEAGASPPQNVGRTRADLLAEEAGRMTWSPPARPLIPAATPSTGYGTPRLTSPASPAAASWASPGRGGPSHHPLPGGARAPPRS